MNENSFINSEESLQSNAALKIKGNFNVKIKAARFLSLFTFDM